MWLPRFTNYPSASTANKHAYLYSWALPRDIPVQNTNGDACYTYRDACYTHRLTKFFFPPPSYIPMEMETYLKGGVTSYLRHIMLVQLDSLYVDRYWNTAYSYDSPHSTLNTPNVRLRGVQKHKNNQKMFFPVSFYYTNASEAKFTPLNNQRTNQQLPPSLYLFYDEWMWN